MKKIAVFASGTGTNAVKILEYARQTGSYEVSLAVTNRADSVFASRMLAEGVKLYVVNNAFLSCEKPLSEVLLEKDIDLVVLAGFLRKIPDELIQTFPDRIVNIHPALLPKYGGKGMYGMHVHEAVRTAQEAETGITIHLVNEEYDKGRVLFQASVPVQAQDDAAAIAVRVQKLEWEHYPRVIAGYLQELP